jgi:uncharacterized membrane protein
LYRSPFRLIWLLIGVLFLAVIVAGFASIAYRLYLGQYPLWFGYFPFFGFGWILVMILFGIFAIRLGTRPWRYRRYDPAMHLLRKRYARGEISKEQFEQMAHDLQDHRYER